MSYAEKTKVPIYRSQAEIQKLLSKYGASAFAFAGNKTLAVIQFEMKNKRIKFSLPLPDESKFKSQTLFEQKCRSQWRGLVLCIKAKLECVEAGITTFEQEFMPHIMLPNGKTVGDVVLPEIESSYQNREMPLLLGMR